MASNGGSEIFYLITNELLTTQGESQDGLVPGPQPMRRLPALQDTSQAIGGVAPHAKTRSIDPQKETADLTRVQLLGPPEASSELFPLLSFPP